MWSASLFRIQLFLDATTMTRLVLFAARSSAQQADHTIGMAVHGLDRNRAARQFALVQSVRGLFAGSLALRKLTIAPERRAVNIRGLVGERAVDIDNRNFLNPLVTHHHGNLRAAEPINGNTLKERLLK